MATKKQKHQAALEKRKRFMEAAKADGLKALRKDQERRAYYREKREKEERKKGSDG